MAPIMFSGIRLRLLFAPTTVHSRHVLHAGRIVVHVVVRLLRTRVQDVQADAHCDDSG
jgi:hypothetical protein